jgi:hypothetical protein
VKPANPEGFEMMRKIILAFVFACVGLTCLSSNAIADLIIAEGKPTGQ